MNGKIDPTPSPKETSRLGGIVAITAVAAVLAIGLIYLLQA